VLVISVLIANSLPKSLVFEDPFVINPALSVRTVHFVLRLACGPRFSTSLTAERARPIALLMLDTFGRIPEASVAKPPVLRHWLRWQSSLAGDIVVPNVLFESRLIFG